MSQPAEFEMLAEELFTLSRELLQKMDGFYPHAAFVNKEGRLEMLALHLGEHPDPGEVHEGLVALLREQAGAKGYRATGIAADGRATNPADGEKADAILVFLEAPSSQAITIAMQYRKTAEGYEYATTFGFKRVPEVFCAD